MQIRLNKELISTHEDQLIGKYGIRERNWEYVDNVDIDLRKIPLDGLNNLKEMFESAISVRGAKTIVRDITAWLQVIQDGGAKKVKAKKVEHARSLLQAYINQSPRKHIYAREEGEDGALLAYYVERVNYHPSERDNPAYITIDVFYEEFGIVSKNRIHLNSSDVLGLTAPDILRLKGYMLEAPILRHDYEDNLAAWHDAKDRIGTEYLGVGLADDSGIDGNDRARNDGGTAQEQPICGWIITASHLGW